MGTVINFLLCSFVVVIAQDEVTLEPDRPCLRAPLSGQADLECCWTTTGTRPVEFGWLRYTFNKTQQSVDVSSNRVTASRKSDSKKDCGVLHFTEVLLDDSGMYLCLLNSSNVRLQTHGTYLQIYRPLKKTINLSEITKNKILTAQGILLLLCVLLPAATLIFQSRRLNELEKKKVKKEEENIYQGLNLDDCCATYDQIERSQAQGPYQDVCNIMEEEEEIQLEKP